MTPLRTFRPSGWLAIAALVLAAAPARAEEPLGFSLQQQRVADRPLVQRDSYNYAPAIIHDGANFHLYWCAGVAGDFILHAQAATMDGPWHAAANPAPATFDVALQPTGSPATFDGLHTCDPNVLKLGSRYFLYYSGASAEGALTAIGVATSTDGVHFERLNGGRPIVTPAKTNPDFAAAHLTYGAGQPAATYVAPDVYLSFTDSTGAGVNKGNGAGQFALRSADPTFARAVQELTGAGWMPREAGRHTAEYAYIESFGLDLAYDPLSHAIIAASDRTAQQVSIFALDPETMRTLGTGSLAMNWREGPAIVAEADKSMARRSDCSSLPIGIAAAEGASADPFSWHTLAYSSAVLSIGSVCGPRRR